MPLLLQSCVVYMKWMEQKCSGCTNRPLTICLHNCLLSDFANDANSLWGSFTITNDIVFVVIVLKMNILNNKKQSNCRRSRTISRSCPVPPSSSSSPMRRGRPLWGKGIVTFEYFLLFFFYLFTDKIMLWSVGYELYGDGEAGKVWVLENSFFTVILM